MISTICRTRTSSNYYQPKLLIMFVRSIEKKLVDDFLSFRLISTVLYQFVWMVLIFHQNYDNCLIINVHFIWMLQLKMRFHLKVIHWFLLSVNVIWNLCKAFKRCVTTFLSRERECEPNNPNQGNWSIVDQGVNSFDRFSFERKFVYLVSNNDHYWLCLRWD